MEQRTVTEEWELKEMVVAPGRAASENASREHVVLK